MCKPKFNARGVIDPLLKEKKMDNKILTFEKKAFEVILNNSLEEGRINKEMYNQLQRQHNNAKISYKYTGIGFYFDYAIVKDADKCFSDRIILGGAEMHSPYIDKCGVELILFVGNGEIRCLEGQGDGMTVCENF